MERKPEPELMDLPDEVAAYAKADFSEVNRQFVERLVELSGGFDRADALDLGCGPGDIAIRVARARPKWRITAIDASQPMLDWAAKEATKHKVTDRIAFRLGDAKKLSMAGKAFDVVFSNSLLHHITDADAMWSEIARVARPRAIFFVRDLFRPADAAAAKAIVEQHAGGESELLKQEFYRSLLSAYSPEEIRKQLDSAGLSQLSVRTISDRHVEISGAR